MNIIEKRVCAFCQPNEVKRPHFEKNGVPRIDTISLIQTDTVTVMPDMLPSDPDGNHVIFVPRVHDYSSAVVSKKTREEIGQAANKFAQTVGKEMIFFEHGCIEEALSPISIAHLHVHGIATEQSIIPYMEDRFKAQGIVFERINTPDPSPAENAHINHRNEPYLFIQQGNTGLFVRDLGYTLPSQILQFNISKLLSGVALNWKQISGNMDMEKMSIERISKVVDVFRG